MDNQESSSNSKSAASSMETQSPIASDEEMLAMFAAQLAEQREHWKTIMGTESPDDPEFKRAQFRLGRIENETPETLLDGFKKEQLRKEELEKCRAKQEAKEIEEAKQKLWSNFLDLRGKRYAPCRLQNFDCADEKQRTALEVLLRYRDGIADNIQKGKNLILFGPSGTGKDHLVTGMVHAAIGSVDTSHWQARGLVWTDGPSLFARVRAEMSDDTRGADIVDRLQECWLLVISDLVPPAGKLTDFQTEVVYRILDNRYSRVKPTFLTINVRNRAELDAGLGVAVAERLIDDAITISCDWPSYRKADKGAK